MSYKTKGEPKRSGTKTAVNDGGGLKSIEGNLVHVLALNGEKGVKLGMSGKCKNRRGKVTTAMKG